MGVEESSNSEQNSNPLQHTPTQSAQAHTPVTTPQRAGSSSASLPIPSESLLSLGLSNGVVSQESMDTDLETPLSGAHVVADTALFPPPTTTAASAQTSNKKGAGKKKKKRGRKPKDKSQVSNSAATNSVQSPAIAESGGTQQPNAMDQNNRTPVGGAVVGGVPGHHAAGDDVLRSGREPMEVENRRRSIGSSSSISMPPLPSQNPHHLNNSYSGVNQAHPPSETGQTGQSRLTDHHRGSSVQVTPSRDGMGLPLGPGGVVRVKQEPITNHEEEMETSQPAYQHQRQPATKVSTSPSICD